MIVVKAGYGAAFLTLAGIALAAFIVFLIAMPETTVETKTHRNEGATSSEPAQAATAEA